MPVLRRVMKQAYALRRHSVTWLPYCRAASTTQPPDAQKKRHETQMWRCCTYVHTSLISSSPPRRLDAAVQPGSCYPCSLAQAYDGGTIATIDEVNVLSACVMRTTVLRRYASLPFAVCKCIQPVSTKPAGFDAAAARAPVLEKCNRSPVLKTGTG